MQSDTNVDYVGDKGVPVEWAPDGEHLVNTSKDAGDAHRRALRVSGKLYAHVDEDAQGRWLYRHDI